MTDPTVVVPPTRDELLAMVARAHGDAPYAEAQLAGRALAAQSALPTLVAENLGAGFGQWDFFPEAEDIVAFALGYAAPASEDELWTLARAWAADDAEKKPTILALVGKEILQHELKRIDVPQLRELLAARPTQAVALRASLGLAVPTTAASRSKKPRAERVPPAEVPPGAVAASAPGAPSASFAGAPSKPREPGRMPKPAFVKPKAKAEAVVRHFTHPKFGRGVLVTIDGEGPDAKLTLTFGAGTKTLLARYVVEDMGST